MTERRLNFFLFFASHSRKVAQPNNCTVFKFVKIIWPCEAFPSLKPMAWGQLSFERGLDQHFPFPIPFPLAQAVQCKLDCTCLVSSFNYFSHSLLHYPGHAHHRPYFKHNCSLSLSLISQIFLGENSLAVHWDHSGKNSRLLPPTIALKHLHASFRNLNVWDAFGQSIIFHDWWLFLLLNQWCQRKARNHRRSDSEVSERESS